MLAGVPDETEIRPAVDFALLADSAQVMGGKLYILGGGWNTLFVNRFPVRHPSLAVGLRIRVPWSLTDRTVTVGLDLEDEDGGRVLPTAPITQAIKVSRAPMMPEGSDIVIARSFTFSNLTFEKPGGYAFLITIDGEVSERLRFTILSRRG